LAVGADRCGIERSVTDDCVGVVGDGLNGDTGGLGMEGETLVFSVGGVDVCRGKELFDPEIEGVRALTLLSKSATDAPEFSSDSSASTTSQLSSGSRSAALSFPFREKIRPLESSPLPDDGRGNLPRLVVLLKNEYDDDGVAGD
jgi:hypothetical protein